MCDYRRLVVKASELTRLGRPLILEVTGITHRQLTTWRGKGGVFEPAHKRRLDKSTVYSYSLKNLVAIDFALTVRKTNVSLQRVKKVIGPIQTAMSQLHGPWKIVYWPKSQNYLVTNGEALSWSSDPVIVYDSWPVIEKMSNYIATRGATGRDRTHGN